MRKIIYLSFIVLFATCGNPKKDLQIPAMKKGLCNVREAMIRENQISANEIKRTYMSYPERLKKYFEVDENINKIARQFAEPEDSAMLTGALSEKEIKEKYDLTISKMLGEFDCFDRYMKKVVQERIARPEFIELSNDREIRGVNILSNQINILELQLKYQLQILSYVRTDNLCFWNVRIIDNKAEKIGEQYKAYMIYAVKEEKEQKKYWKLEKLTLDGKDYKTDYSFITEDGVTSFNFKPTKPGLYEWETREYFLGPNGDYLPFTFTGKVRIK